MDGVTRRCSALLLGLALIAGGTWQVGGAAYIHAKAWLAQGLIAHAWDQTLARNRTWISPGQGDLSLKLSSIKPWPWADTWPVARMTVPRLDVERMVLAGGSGRTLAFGPGHLGGSAPPGKPGHTVIGGHRDTHFRFLKDLRVGDRIILGAADGRDHAYRVRETRVVDARTARLAVGGPESLLTLVTCYPFDAVIPGGPLRYLVIAERTGEMGLAQDTGPAVYKGAWTTRISSSPTSARP